MTSTATESTAAPLGLTKELGDGLILRRATKADADAVAEFNKRVHYEKLGVSVGELMTADNPIISANDFVVAVDTKAHDRIAASVALFSNTWSYDDVPFRVGTPECVGTDPDYRHRGLMRAAFDAVHNLRTVLPAIHRATKALIVQYDDLFQNTKPTHIDFVLGTNHPAYEILRTDPEPYTKPAFPRSSSSSCFLVIAPWKSCTLPIPIAG